MSNITRQQLINLLEQLVSSQGNWNQTVADDDRGPNNNALCIILYDDGSGVIGDFSGFVHGSDLISGHSHALSAKAEDIINVQCDFPAVEQAADWLIEYHQALESQE